MLETIHAFSLAKLRESGEEAAVARQHAAFFLAMAEGLSSRLFGRQQAALIAGLERDDLNLGLAMRHLLERGEVEACLRMAVSLEWYWERSFHHIREGLAFLKQALARSEGLADRSLLSKALRNFGWLTFLTGDWVAGNLALRQSLALAEDCHDSACRTMALFDLGVNERWMRRLEDGRAHTEAAIALARESGDRLLLVTALIWAYATTGGKFKGEPPLRELEEAHHLATEAGYPWFVAHAAQGLGDLLRELGDYEPALLRYAESLELFQDLNDRWLAAWTLWGMGKTHSMMGQAAEAVARLKESVALFSEIGDRVSCLESLGELGFHLWRAGGDERAAILVSAYKTGFERMLGAGAGEAWRGKDYETSVFAGAAAASPSAWARGRGARLEELLELAASIQTGPGDPQESPRVPGRPTCAQ
jgi:tetratricopeptide (TPR) repeat protein